MGTVFFMSLILLMYLWQHLPFNRKVGVLLFFFSGLAMNVLVFMILYNQLVEPWLSDSVAFRRDHGCQR